MSPRRSSGEDSNAAGQRYSRRHSWTGRLSKHQRGRDLGAGSIGQGLHSDAIIRSLALHPAQPRTVFAGSDLGLYKSDDAGASWQLLDTPMTRQAIWQIAFDPADPQTMLAGTGTPNTPCLFRSNDGAVSWKTDQVEIARECPAVGVPRPTGIAFDPGDSNSVWLGLEVDGMRRTQDGGATWVTAASEIHNMDVHNVAMTAGPPKTIFVLVNNDIWSSSDDGESWQALGVKQRFAPFGYPRGITVNPDDPRVVYITLGDATPGRVGRFCAATTRARPGSSCHCRLPRTLQCGSSTLPKPSRRSCLPEAATAISIGAMTAGTISRSSGVSSARSPRSPTFRRNHASILHSHHGG